MSESGSKKNILKNTGIIGGSQVFTILIQIIRTKIIAVLIGSQGIGLIGLLNSVIDLSKNLFGLGIGFSAVKDLSIASSQTEDAQQLGKTTMVVYRWGLLTAFTALFCVFLFAKPLSSILFDEDSYTVHLRIIAVACFFNILNSINIAILQGIRRLGDMAKASIYGASVTLIFILPLYWVWGVDAVPLALVLVSLISCIISFVFVYKKHIPVRSVKVSLTETYERGKSLISLGIISSLSLLLSSFSMFVIKSFISNSASLETLGHFQACWSVANTYLLIVLNAMGTDYFPRLSIIFSKNRLHIKEINNQLNIALLVGGPLVIGISAFSPLILLILYSSEFSVGSVLLSMFIAGSFFKLLSWPFSYIFPAIGKNSYIIATEALWNVVFLGVSFILWQYLEINGIGIAYIVSYLIYLIVVYCLSRSSVTWRVSKANMRMIILYFFLMVVSTMFMISSSKYFNIVPVVCFMISCIYSYRQLKHIISFNDIYSKIFKHKG